MMEEAQVSEERPVVGNHLVYMARGTEDLEGMTDDLRLLFSELSWGD